MKKKLVVVLLTAAMSMSLLAGCGGNSGSSDAKSDARMRALQTAALMQRQRIRRRTAIRWQQTRWQN